MRDSSTTEERNAGKITVSNREFKPTFEAKVHFLSAVHVGYLVATFGYSRAAGLILTCGDFRAACDRYCTRNPLDPNAGTVDVCQDARKETGT